MPFLYEKIDDLEQAETFSRVVVTARRASLDHHQWTFRSIHSLATLLGKRRNPEEARALLRETGVETPED